MKNIKGFNYSTKQYDDYKFRAKFEYKILDKDYTESIDIYTDNPNKDSVHEEMYPLICMSLLGIDSAKTKMIHWASKEQDDAAGELIDMVLNN